MNWSIIKSLVTKDLKEIFRNKFSTFMIIIVLVNFTVIYMVMPKTVDETIDVAFYTADLPLDVEEAGEQGIALIELETADEVKKQIEEEEYQLGIVLGEGFFTNIQQGLPPEVTVYYSQKIAPEMKEALQLLLQESAYQLTGTPLPVQLATEVVGTDMVGQQIPERERTRSMFISFVLLIELMSLSSLILEEIDNGVLRGILISPASVKDILVSKVITGFLLAFGETVILTAFLGAFSGSALIVLLVIILGAIMISGLSFLVGSLAKDATSSFGWSMLIFVVLVIPSIAIMMPGGASGWVKAVPSYYFIDALDQASNYAATFGQVWLSLTILLGVSLILFVAGYYSLRKRVTKL